MIWKLRCENTQNYQNCVNVIARTVAIVSGIVALVLFCRPSSLEVHIASVECEDGSKVSPLSITFPQGKG